MRDTEVKLTNQGSPFSYFISALESRLLNRFDVQRYAREAYEMGIRYIGACCGMEPYHVRAITEEASIFHNHSY